MKALFFNRMVIVGVGLIGGSLAIAGRRKGLVKEIIGVGRGAANLKEAVNLNIIDSFTFDISEAIKGADLIVLATPVGSFEGLVKQMKHKLNKGAIITDAGSVKGIMVSKLERLLPKGTYFVAGHPIAGKEKSGVKAASHRLFEGTKCILTPTKKTDASALKKVKALWRAVGAEVVLMDPMLHDKVLGAVSHLPHAAAYSIVNTVAEIKKDGNNFIAFSGGGFKDFTRIAASSPEMWRDIFLSNRENLVNMISRYQKNLEKLKRYIKDKDSKRLIKELEKAKAVRDRLN
ncbi:MAG: prephenate dehydrogenase/arogenate dehydrogenase family protein [Nitrospirae bacterium]|nr:prephenate dehydrogenase/arogenate dehydrogenase family protein [Nitrospirota bacterium]